MAADPSCMASSVELAALLLAALFVAGRQLVRLRQLADGIQGSATTPLFVLSACIALILKGP